MCKQLQLIFICVISVLQVGCEQDSEALRIVMKSLEAHGGIEKWKAVKELSYEKITILYDSLGVIEQKTKQTHFNKFLPKFSAVMEWVDDTIQKKVLLDESHNGISIYYDNQLRNDTGLENVYYKNIIAANYVLWQPFKLLDKGAKLSYEGEELLENEKRVQVIKVMYPKKEENIQNIWWYYFDVQTNKLLGNLVQHGTTWIFYRC